MPSLQLPKQTKKLTTLFLLTGALLLVLVVWAWWHYVRSNPERTFYAAISNAMQTKSVSNQIVQEAPGQKLEQNLEAVLSPEHVVHGTTVISQNGETNATVRTESISTPREDYVRYSNIKTDQKSQTSGKVLDFSKLVDVWGRTQPADKTKTTGELYGETVLGVVPLGNLSAGDRTEIMAFVKGHKVYKFNESEVKHKLVNGRPTYVYQVQVSTEAWVGMLKRFAKAVGLTQLESIDPASYRESQPLEAEMIVDVWSRQLTGLSYSESGRTEKLGSYGLWHDVSIPKKTIPVEELQKRLQSVQ